MDTQTTKADKGGKWRVTFAVRNAGGPYSLLIEGSDRIALENVMVGEVWVCSEQSNMQWTVRRPNKANTEIASEKWPNIRLFTVKRTIAGEPQSDVEGSWSECSPESIPGFSTVVSIR